MSSPFGMQFVGKLRVGQSPLQFMGEFVSFEAAIQRNGIIMSVVVIGAGQAGLQTIMSLRQGGYEDAITLIGDEAYLPYQRPPLSKAYLSGKMERERLFLKPEGFYDDNNVTLKLDTEVASIDAAGKTLALNNGETLAYDHAVIATGSRPRLLDVLGRELSNIFDLRGMADIDAMQSHFVKGKRLVVVGGGYIGLEAAAVAADMGMSVHVLEAAPRLLARVAERKSPPFIPACIKTTA